MKTVDPYHHHNQDHLYHHAHNHPRYPQYYDPHTHSHIVGQHDHLHDHHHPQFHGSHIEPHLHSPQHSHTFDPHFLHNNDASHLHSLPPHVISHVPYEHHQHNDAPEIHRIPLPSPDPFLIQANEALEHVLSLNSPKNPHDNHDQISLVLEKLRTTNSTKPVENSDLMYHRKIGKRNWLGLGWLGGVTQTTPKATNVDDAYHPTVISNEDKWIAGCLMQCVFRRNGAVDKLGYPTLDGITDLYTAGVSEQPFFMHVLRAVDKCLKTASVKYKIHKGQTPPKGETCDVSFDVFDCVSDSITDYCSG